MLVAQVGVVLGEAVPGRLVVVAPAALVEVLFAGAVVDAAVVMPKSGKRGLPKEVVLNLRSN